MSNGARLAALAVVVAVAAGGLYMALMQGSSPAPAEAGSGEAQVAPAVDAPSGTASGAASLGGTDTLPAEAFGGPGTSVPASTTPETGGSLDLGAGAPAQGTAPSSPATGAPAGPSGAGPASVGTAPVTVPTVVPPPPAPAGAEHVIKRGDTLEGIARERLGDARRWREIAAANPTVNPENLKVGTTLKLPAGTTPKLPAGGSPAEATGAAPEPAAASGNTYTVQRGDTLVALSRKFYGNDAEWQRILGANKALLGGDAKNLKPGMKLVIPAKR